MKKTVLNILILATMVFSSCALKTSQGKDESESNDAEFSPILIGEWKELKCGLYVKENGELGFPSVPVIAHLTVDELDEWECPNVFITKVGSNYDNILLKDIIDTTSFETLGANYYKDKNHIYSHYAMCDGGYFKIFSDDTSGFYVYEGSKYSRHKSKIYHYRNGEVNADLESFQAFSDEFSAIARDKDGYFAFNERISEAELKESLGEALFQQMKISEK